jgi:hypothetical protein
MPTTGAFIKELEETTWAGSHETSSPKFLAVDERRHCSRATAQVAITPFECFFKGLRNEPSRIVFS